jgi:hypothetical protein
MNVTIVKNNHLFDYDMSQPIEQQLKGSSEVLVNYVEEDEVVHHFLDEVERLSQSAFGYGMKIKVFHNDSINGAKAKKLMSEVSKNLSVNDIIQMMTNIHKETDDKLTEIAKMCSGNDCDE